MARKSKPIGYRIFVGDRPLEDLTPEERDAFSDSVVERMGKAFNDYFSVNPDVYQKFTGVTEAHE